MTSVFAESMSSVTTIAESDLDHSRAGYRKRDDCDSPALVSSPRDWLALDDGEGRGRLVALCR